MEGKNDPVSTGFYETLQVTTRHYKTLRSELVIRDPSTVIVEWACRASAHPTMSSKCSPDGHCEVYLVENPARGSRHRGRDEKESRRPAKTRAAGYGLLTLTTPEGANTQESPRGFQYYTRHTSEHQHASEHLSLIHI